MISARKVHAQFKGYSSSLTTCFSLKKVSLLVKKSYVQLKVIFFKLEKLF